MRDKVIHVSSLSKSYKISHRLERNAHPTLRDDVVHLLRKPLSWIGAAGGSQREEFWALRDIEFEVSQGDVVGIMGRNGSGKSTLFKILSRVTEPTTGKVVINGDTASLLEVGTGFHPELTGRENVYFNGAILGMSRKQIDEKFDEIVAFAEVERFLDTPVKFFSSGMKVRLAFSVAASLDPEILIIDEVLAVGDVKFKKKSLERMQSIARDEGKTILFVSHIIGQVEKICNRGIILDGGQIVHDGNLDEAIDVYLDLNETEEDVGDDLAGVSGGRDEIQSQFIGFENLDATVQKSGAFPELDLKISLLNLDGENHDNLHMSFLIADQFGKNVSNISTERKNLDLKLERGVATRDIHLKVRNLNLVPDKYAVSVSLRDLHDESLTYFRKYNATQFQVPEYTAFGIEYPKSRGKLPPVIFDFTVD